MARIFGTKKLISLIGEQDASLLRGALIGNQLNGGFRDDNLTGTSAGDVMNGRFGDDTLDGLDGPDTMDGGFGDDTFIAGEGDVIDGGRGNDTAEFDFDFDDADFALQGSVLVVTVGTDEPIRLTSVETFVFNDVTYSYSQLLDAIANDAPVIDEDQTFSVAEDAEAGDVVGTVTASDADGDAITYAIASGNADGIFAIDEFTGEITIANPANLDFETTESYDLVIRATDSEGASDLQTVTIDVTDVEEPLPPEITVVETDPLDYSRDEDLTDAAAVVNPDGDYNGGTVTIAINDEFRAYFGSDSIVFVGEGDTDARFSLAGNQIIADGSVTASGEDEVIGEVAFDDDDRLFFTITFTSDEVNDATVSALLTDLQLAGPIEIDGCASIGEVTVTVTDAAGLSDSFTRVLDSSGDVLTFSGLSGDDRVVEEGDATNVAIDVGGDASLDNVEIVSGTVLTVGSSVATDALHFDNTTGARGAAGTVRAVGEFVTISLGSTEKIVGTVTGRNTANLTITFNNTATEEDIANVLDSIQINLDTNDRTVRTITTTATDGGGFETDSVSSTIEIIDDFVNATVDGEDVGGDSYANPLLWSEIDAALNADPGQTVVINGNTYIQLDVEAPDTDLTDALVTIAPGATIRFVSDGPVDLTAVTGLNTLGDLVFGTDLPDEPFQADLTLTATQIDGATINSEADVTVTELQANPDVDLSGFSIDGGTYATASVPPGSPFTFTGDLGDFSLHVSRDGDTGTAVFRIDADLATGKDICVEDGNFFITNLQPATDYDFSGFYSEGLLQALITADLDLSGDAELNFCEVELVVSPNATLTIDAEDADGEVITGVIGTTGTTGGSIVILPPEPEGEATSITLNNLDFDDITPGAAGTGTAGTATMTLTSDTTFTNTRVEWGDFGGVTVEVPAGITVTAEADDFLDGDVFAAPLTGAGNLVLTDLTNGAADLSPIALTGELTAEVPADLEFTGDLGEVDVEVAAGATFTADIDLVSGKTIEGEAAVAGLNGGSILVTLPGGDIDTPVFDLSGILPGAPLVEPAQPGGTVVVDVDVDWSPNAATDLGVAELDLAEEADVDLSPAQLDGRIISGQGSIAVEDLTAATDVTGVGSLISSTFTFTTDTDLSANAGLAGLGGPIEYVIDDGLASVSGGIDVTMTASQADERDLISETGDGRFVVTAVTGLTGDGVVIGGSAAGDILGGSNLSDEIAGGAGADSITGGDGADELLGQGGADSILGGAGDDIIGGGSGVDSLTGGDGNDTFVFLVDDIGSPVTGAGNRDIVTDFEDANIAGGDLIDLTDFGSLEFIEGASFSGAGDEVRFGVAGGNAIIEIDYNGGGTDFQIQLNGVTALTDSDFLLTGFE
ncbi:putative Ca2+-binding hemolysin [Stappia sp. 22II-S9-Z10]|nr:putative Ca2+-binding hemolysin [Stappia sp. 22II-S9-Z10]